MKSTQTLRWGILGTASIARRQAIPAIRQSRLGVLKAIGSRDEKRAKQFAEQFHIPYAFGSYDQVVACDAVDAIYIALPNDMHLPWVETAARAGKHVLCENPLGLNARQVMHIMDIAAQTGVQVMEAVPSYFHPLHQRVQEMIREGAVGAPIFYRFSLGWSFRHNPDDFRWQKQHGGGALLDLGGYLISTARRLTGEEPIQVVARAFYPPTPSDSSSNEAAGGADEGGVDANMAIMLQFSSSAALIDLGIMTASRNCYEIIGEDGKIIVENPFGNRAESRRLLLYDHQGRLQKQKAFNDHQFQLQFDAVTEAFAAGSPMPVSLEESLANALVMDACVDSARQGGLPVAVATQPFHRPT